MAQSDTSLQRGLPEALQENQYRLPYHYLPRFESGHFRFHEVLSWGHEYLSYMTHVSGVVAERPWSSLLDIGCGDGRLVSLLKEKFPTRRVVGLDYSERAIALARAMVPDAEFVAGDITSAELFQEKFDCATCVETIEHIEPSFLPAFVQGVRQQLKAEACLVVTVPSTNLKLAEKHYQHFTAETLSATLSGPFEVQRISHLNGSSRLVNVLRRLLTNRLYTVTHPKALTSFYSYYVRNHLESDSVRGGRILAVCRAR